MAAAALKVLVVVVSACLAGAAVSAETHHVVGGPNFNVTDWLLGRLFTVGDKLRLEDLGADESLVEVKGLKELESCDVANPIRMYTEAVALEEEGIRYFTTANRESCRKGLKLPVAVRRGHDFDPDAHEFDPDEPYPPYKPDVPSPPHKHDEPYPPYEPDVPSPPHKPDVPYPPFDPPPKPPTPSAAARLKTLYFVLSAAVSVYCLGI